jgi:TolB-like protein/Flp pilus assembly protein TadD
MFSVRSVLRPIGLLVNPASVSHFALLNIVLISSQKTDRLRVGGCDISATGDARLLCETSGVLAMGRVQPSDDKTIQFGIFEVNLRAGELRKRGIKIKLQEQPLQILQILLDNPGNVVTREELQQKIWPADTFVDFDHGLNNAIRRLREALGDSADTPRYIETLARRGYRFIGSLGADPASTPSPIRSLAVLPLENLSHDPQQEYFAEGLTEALITALAKIGELRVVSRTSVLQYKGVHKPVREIARELEVDAIVEGTVLRAGRRVRITAQLIDAPKETHLWAESYERDLRDVLTLQSEVAQAIAREIRIKLTPQEQAHFGLPHPVDPEAYEAYLKGRYHWNRRSGEALPKAVESFRQAIAKDPTHAASYSGLADCLSVLGYWGLVPPNEGCGKAKGLARKALEMDHSLPEAHASLAFAAMFYDYDFVTAEREFERSIELNPRYGSAHQWFGLSLAFMGRYEEGFAEVKRAVRLDPHSITFMILGSVICFAARRYDQAVKQLEKALEADSGLAQAHSMLGLTYALLSMNEPAIAHARRAVELSEGVPFFLGFLGDVYATAGHREEADNILERLLELAKQRYVTPYAVGVSCAALGRKDEALRWLETAYRGRDPLLVCLKTDPRLDGVRSEPRFQDLLRCMKFPA